MSRALKGKSAGLPEMARMVVAMAAGVGSAATAERRALDAFVRGSRGADAVFVFIPRRGLQIGGQNFLLPTDATFDTAATLQNSALALDEIFV
jgi:uncharacterized caspase-like protein